MLSSSRRAIAIAEALTAPSSTSEAARSCKERPRSSGSTPTHIASWLRFCLGVFSTEASCKVGEKGFVTRFCKQVDESKAPFQTWREVVAAPVGCRVKNLAGLQVCTKWFLFSPLLFASISSLAVLSTPLSIARHVDINPHSMAFQQICLYPFYRDQAGYPLPFLRRWDQCLWT